MCQWQVKFVVFHICPSIHDTVIRATLSLMCVALHRPTLQQTSEKMFHASRPVVASHAAAFPCCRSTHLIARSHSVQTRQTNHGCVSTVAIRLDAAPRGVRCAARAAQAPGDTFTATPLVWSPTSIVQRCVFLFTHGITGHHHAY